MAGVCVVVDDDEGVREFVEVMGEKLQDHNMVSNPFKGGVCLDRLSGGRLAVWLAIEPVWPNVAPYVAFVGVAVWLVFGWHAWVVVPSLAIGLLSLFWSAPFYSLMLRAGLRKAGYSGPFRVMRGQRMVECHLEGRRGSG